MNKPYLVCAEWDVEACVWVATSDDVPGLVTEADTLEVLNDKLITMVPELLVANGVYQLDCEVDLKILARRQESA